VAMAIVVTCPCGRGYSKPDHKAGMLFRCHLCGRELMIPDGSVEKPSAPQAVKPTVWESESEKVSEADASELRPPLLRVLLAWFMISLGLAGIVGGLGMVYILSIAQNTAKEDAQARVRIFGQEQF